MHTSKDTRHKTHTLQKEREERGEMEVGLGKRHKTHTLQREREERGEMEVGPGQRHKTHTLQTERGERRRGKTEMEVGHFMSVNQGWLR